MKANELQIYDWVYWGEQHSNIDGDYDLEFHQHQIKLDDFFFLSENDWEENEDLEFVEPIQLDEEILELNGFENYELHGWLLKKQWQWSVTIHLYETGVIISINKEIEGHKGVDSCHICYKGYVHELQHALRLCGLDDLANNFKVEWYEKV